MVPSSSRIRSRARARRSPSARCTQLRAAAAPMLWCRARWSDPESSPLVCRPGGSEVGSSGGVPPPATSPSSRGEGGAGGEDSTGPDISCIPDSVEEEAPEVGFRWGTRPPPAHPGCVAGRLRTHAQGRHRGGAGGDRGHGSTGPRRQQLSSRMAAGRGGRGKIDSALSFPHG
jgi:hypothetical protein